jgi:hypothetical protein
MRKNWKATYTQPRGIPEETERRPRRWTLRERRARVPPAGVPVVKVPTA